ncbi:hypothetical protein [Novosphingobium album (ex Liu et al. 2023)]|uniref:Cell division protein FtsL n=1 Tax=Novosphingobium album (ex Liu et al. 2023) TaxID=3031130 RepID=A0ABT5WK29_9SPHN|nr:hypothetical protein [Novosphingobium album (ex Liu et al. 2023)]MDE8650390.1 hypothetical protein [Novosphingobium album (ex Liu et al. 2023)]
MNLTRDRVQSIGWFTVLLLFGALTLGLGLRVNAVKSQVHDTERHIVALRQDIDQLQTEFQTRSNQQQLKAINDIDFGYQAPRAEQYIEGERQLAALGLPRGPGAPEPIRMAHGDGAAAEPAASNPVIAMVSPITGTPANAAEARGAVKSDSGEEGSGRAEARTLVRDAAELGNRLARIKVARAGTE